MRTKIPWKKEQLWRGSVIAGIAHAIMVAHYPLMANEHSWDGMNYSVQDSAGQRGTISFRHEWCVAAFRNDHSERLFKDLSADYYLRNAPKEILDLAHSEALLYLLDEVNGENKPVITTAFWGMDELFSNDSFENMQINGGDLLEYHFFSDDMAIELWKEEYDMSLKQVQLLKLLSNKKLTQFHSPVILSTQEIAMIGTDDSIGLLESKASFEEIRIYFQDTR